MIKAIIIDDEQLARDLIRSFLKDHPAIEVIAECADGFEGLKAIQELSPDLVFLDIQMPRITGLEMLELIENPPVVIFSTAYHEYAIKAFEMNAVDYLLKPFSKERFGKALEKASGKLQLQDESKKQIQELIKDPLLQTEKTDRVVVKTASKIKVIPVSTLLYLEAQDDYVMLYTAEGKFLKQQTMKYFESSLDPSQFIRVHRSYIVNINEIVQLEPYEKDSYRAVLKNNVKLPISRSGYSGLKKKLDF
jgi:two-component system LytT family response regulator